MCMYESMLFCKPKACLLCVLCSAAFCMQFQLGLTVDTSTCNECIKCTHSISQPAYTKSDINSFTCEHEPRVKNGSCFLHNEKCLTLQELKNNKDLLKDLDTTLCCVFKNMSSPCNNGGQFKCPNRKDEPVCECLYGFEGERCQEKATQPVVQLCWIVCGYQFTNQCDQINANWTECPTDDGTSKNLGNCLQGTTIKPKNGSTQEPTPKADPISGSPVGGVVVALVVVVVVVGLFVRLN